MKLFNKKTVLTVLITAMLCFGVSSFASIYVPVSDCKCGNPSMKYYSKVYDRSYVYRNCEHGYAATVGMFCADCDGFIGDHGTIYSSDTSMAGHKYITFYSQDEDKYYDICEVCGDVVSVEKPTESETEEPTQPETDHEHQYNKKGKCKICGQMMP